MEWQPIETAPKDGKPILVRHDLCWAEWPEDIVAAYKQVKHGDFFEGEVQSMVSVAAWTDWAGEDGGCPWLMCNVEFCEIAGNPTHWMPLPEPPQ